MFDDFISSIMQQNLRCVSMQLLLLWLQLS